MVTKVDSGVIVHDGGTIKDALDKSKPIADYVALRAYTGNATQVRITNNGIAGFFYYDAADTISADNGGTVIVASNGKRWKRLFTGPAKFEWFGATGASDDTGAISNALNSGFPIDVTDGKTFICSSVSASNVILTGFGVLKKKAGTKGAMITLSGDNTIRDVSFDYDWANANQALPYSSNSILSLNGGSLDVLGANFLRSFSHAISNSGGSLSVGFSKFSGGAPHNSLSGGNERVTDYISCTATSTTENQRIKISDNIFIGASTDTNLLHLNPCAVFITASGVDGVRFKHVDITDNEIVACGQNAGAGNFTGAIDTYNGVENLVISGNTIRYFSYAGIKVQNSSNFAITGNTVLDGNSPAGSAADQSVGILTYEKVRNATAEQYNGTIIGNIIKGTKYYAIGNAVDNVAIVGNIIDGVTKAILGYAILNAGSNVTIEGNIGSSIGGTFVQTDGNRVKVISNTFTSNSVVDGGGIGFSGNDIKIKSNTFLSAAGSTFSGIRTDGNASNIVISENTVSGFNNGTDVRTTSGTVDAVDIGINYYSNIGNVIENIAAGVTNVSRARKNLSQIQVTYDPPSLAVGTCGPVQTLTITGAEFGDEVYGTGVRDMKGLYVMAWVSASNTVSWAVCNPPGNLNGTQDFPSTYFRFRVIKQQL